MPGLPQKNYVGYCLKFLPPLRVFITAAFLFWPHTQALAGHLHLEKFYQKQWCTEHSGVMEYRLGDRTRVDCLTDEYAIEFDFAAKWAESVGQSLYYAMQTGKRPGVVLIMEDDGDERFLARLNALADRYNIKVWTTQ